MKRNIIQTYYENLTIFKGSGNISSRIDIVQIEDSDKYLFTVDDLNIAFEIDFGTAETGTGFMNKSLGQNYLMKMNDYLAILYDFKTSFLGRVGIKPVEDNSKFNQTVIDIFTHTSMLLKDSHTMLKDLIKAGKVNLSKVNDRNIIVFQYNSSLTNRDLTSFMLYTKDMLYKELDNCMPFFIPDAMSIDTMNEVELQEHLDIITNQMKSIIESKKEAAKSEYNKKQMEFDA
jgi:hypothetical protein